MQRKPRAEKQPNSKFPKRVAELKSLKSKIIQSQACSATNPPTVNIEIPEKCASPSSKLERRVQVAKNKKQGPEREQPVCDRLEELEMDRDVSIKKKETKQVQGANQQDMVGNKREKKRELKRLEFDEQKEQEKQAKDVKDTKKREVKDSKKKDLKNSKKKTDTVLEEIQQNKQDKEPKQNKEKDPGLEKDKKQIVKKTREKKESLESKPCKEINDSISITPPLKKQKKMNPTPSVAARRFFTSSEDNQILLFLASNPELKSSALYSILSSRLSRPQQSIKERLKRHLSNLSLKSRRRLATLARSSPSAVVEYSLEGMERVIKSVKGVQEVAEALQESEVRVDDLLGCRSHYLPKGK